jgi:hypothetical protein
MEKGQNIEKMIETGEFTHTDIAILKGSEEKTLNRLNYNGFFIDDLNKSKLKYVKKEKSCYNSPCDGVVI